MTTTTRLSACCLLLAFLLAAPCAAQEKDSQPIPGVRVTTPAPAAPQQFESREARTRRLMQARIDVLVRGDLREGLDAIGGALGLTIEIRQPLQGDGIDETQRVYWNLRGCTVEGALDLMLEWPDLVWMIEEDRIVVLAEDDEAQGVKTETLPIGALIDAKPAWMSEKAFVDALIDCIANAVTPLDFESLAGFGRLERAGGPNKGVLALTASPATRRRAVELIRLLETALATKPPVVTHTFDRRNKALRAALDKRVTLEVLDMELWRVVDKIGRQIGVPVNLDRGALDDMGIGEDTPITFAFRSMHASDALARVLHDLELTWVFRGGTVVVTTREQAYSLLSTVIFDVGDLTPGEGESEDVDSLIRCLTTTVQPTCWQDAGGEGAIASLRLKGRTLLVVSQNREALDEIAVLLDTMRRARRERATVMTPRHDEAAVIAKALEKEVTWHFDDTPLEDAVPIFAASLGIPVFLDKRSLDDMGIGRDTPISLPAGKYTARDVLGRILRELELTVMFEHGGLTITTCEQAEYRLYDAVFDVSDLVTPGRARADAGVLVTCITSAVEPTTWERFGGPGSVFTFASPEGTTLIVSQTQEVIGEITRFLDSLRTVARAKSKVLVVESKKEAAVRKTLQKRVGWAFNETPLPKAVATMAADLGVTVYIDQVRFDDLGIDADEVFLSLPGLYFDADEALRRAIEPHELDFIIANGALVITTRDRAEYCQKRAIYNVTDLIARGETDVKSLPSTLRERVAPETWEEVGGDGVLKPLILPDGQTVLVVLHEERVLRQIGKMLEEMRAR